MRFEWLTYVTLKKCIVLLSVNTVLRYLRTEGKIPGLPMKKFQAFQERSTLAYRIVFTRYTVKRCYRIVSSPGLICLMVNSLMRWWLCSLRVQCSETQSDWNNRSCNNIHSKLVQIHIFSLNYYRTPFWQS